MANIAKVLALRRIARSARLSAAARFWNEDPAVLACCYNGIGPDRWNARFRKWTTRLLRWFEADALIHDWDYTFRPKNYLAFTLSNARFVLNAGRLACFDNEGILRRIARIRRAFFLALLCQLGGYRGYRQGKIK